MQHTFLTDFHQKPTWRNTLNALNRTMQTDNSYVKDVIVQQLRFNYNCLNDPKVQKCFFTCASHHEESPKSS